MCGKFTIALAIGLYERFNMKSATLVSFAPPIQIY
jgi:hypothetical protein